jgi:hypothetical protein
MAATLFGIGDFIEQPRFLATQDRTPADQKSSVAPSANTAFA